MGTEFLKTGDYYIERNGDQLKITLTENRNRNVAIVPLSGNAIIIKPEEKGRKLNK